MPTCSEAERKLLDGLENGHGLLREHMKALYEERLPQGTVTQGVQLCIAFRQAREAWNNFTRSLPAFVHDEYTDLINKIQNIAADRMQDGANHER